MTEPSSEILGKHRPVKQPRVTADILKYVRQKTRGEEEETEGANKYRQEIKKSMAKAKETLVEEQCQYIEEILKMNSRMKRTRWWKTWLTRSKNALSPHRTKMESDSKKTRTT